MNTLLKDTVYIPASIKPIAMKSAIMPGAGGEEVKLEATEWAHYSDEETSSPPKVAANIYTTQKYKKPTKVSGNIH